MSKPKAAIINTAASMLGNQPKKNHTANHTHDLPLSTYSSRTNQLPNQIAMLSIPATTVIFYPSYVESSP